MLNKLYHFVKDLVQQIKKYGCKIYIPNAHLNK